MFVVMATGASEAEVLGVKSRILAEGLTPFDHVSGGRLRHGAKLMRWRPDKAPKQCTYEQIAPLRKA